MLAMRAPPLRRTAQFGQAPDRDLSAGFGLGVRPRNTRRRSAVRASRMDESRVAPTGDNYRDALMWKSPVEFAEGNEGDICGYPKVAQGRRGAAWQGLSNRTTPTRRGRTTPMQSTRDVIEVEIKDHLLLVPSG